MGDQSAYQSQLPWVLDRPTALVIACSDGRWRPHIQDFVTNCLQLDPHFDVLQVPGGAEPLTLSDRVPKDFNFFRRRLDMLRAARRERIARRLRSCNVRGSEGEPESARRFTTRPPAS